LVLVRGCLLVVVVVACTGGSCGLLFRGGGGSGGGGVGVGSGGGGGGLVGLVRGGQRLLGGFHGGRRRGALLCVFGGRSSSSACGASFFALLLSLLRRRRRHHHLLVHGSLRRRRLLLASLRRGGRCLAARHRRRAGVVRARFTRAPRFRSLRSSWQPWQQSGRRLLILGIFRVLLRAELLREGGGALEEQSEQQRARQRPIHPFSSCRIHSKHIHHPPQRDFSEEVWVSRELKEAVRKETKFVVARQRRTHPLLQSLLLHLKVPLLLICNRLDRQQ